MSLMNAAVGKVSSITKFSSMVHSMEIESAWWLVGAWCNLVGKTWNAYFETITISLPTVHLYEEACSVTINMVSLAMVCT